MLKVQLIGDVFTLFSANGLILDNHGDFLNCLYSSTNYYLVVLADGLKSQQPLMKGIILTMRRPQDSKPRTEHQLRPMLDKRSENRYFDLYSKCCITIHLCD